MKLIKKNFIFQDVNRLKGVGLQLSRYLKKRKIEKIKDILFNLPYSNTDRSQITKINQLEIGKIQSVKVLVKKLNFPRIREGYLRKIFPLNEQVIISGKVNYFKKKYQMTNPDYVTKLENKDYVIKKIPKYNLTKGINEKKYRFISEQVINNLPEIEDWLDEDFIKINKLDKWNASILSLHNSKEKLDINSNSFRRLVFDELCANFLSLSENRRRFRKTKNPKNFNTEKSEVLIKNLPFKLTSSQIKVLNEINLDLLSNKRMFRILQGDVGSGKTIVSLISIKNVVESGYQ